ncbi:hypothetical protein TNCV_3489561 [Trichonephila clavipes]|nr:hypothetical protein TNCV_3489561 [Trichonephila clavipes]
MLAHLEDNIRRVIADIRPQMLEKVIENWTSRLDYIRASRGSPMPEIIFKICTTAHEDQDLQGSSHYMWPLSTEVHEQMFRLGNQSELKPPVFSPQASLILFYRPIEGMKGSVDLAQPEG